MRPAFTFLLAAALSAIPWVVADTLTGSREPWDASLLGYGGALFVVGFVAGLCFSRPLWAHAIGCGLGQFIAALLLIEPGALMGVGVLFLAASTVPYLFGVLSAGAVRRPGSSA